MFVEKVFFLRIILMKALQPLPGIRKNIIKRYLPFLKQLNRASLNSPWLLSAVSEEEISVRKHAWDRSECCTVLEWKICRWSPFPPPHPSYNTCFGRQNISQFQNCSHWRAGWRFPVELEAVTVLKSLQATKTTKKDGKNEEFQALLLLLVIGNRDVNSHQNI